MHLLHQLILQLVHLLSQSSSYIDVIFTDHLNLIVDGGVHQSLHSNCHHLITHCKLCLNIGYTPPYEPLVWDYNKTNVEGIKKSIESVNWKVMFNNKQLSAFNETLINIFSNFTPNKLITFDDRDPLG